MNPSVFKRIADGDSVAVGECIDRYGGLVWRLARRLSRTAADAGFATEEIFLALWQSAARFDEAKGSETVFVMLIARRRLIDRLRKTNAEPPMDFLVDTWESAGGLDPAAGTEASLEIEQARQAMQTLRPEYRQVLELGFLYGLTQAEISAQIGLSLVTVQSFMRRAIVCLREAMNIRYSMLPVPTTAAALLSGAQNFATALSCSQDC